MTGVEELRAARVATAAPEDVRVSVLGGRTQLDIALPADVTLAALLPELAELVGSRDGERTDTAGGREERRTFWVLTRAEDDRPLAPEQTLRAAGVSDGALLRLSTRRALSPPTLYDDVVDAAARLNRAAFAAWDATAAAVTATVALWLGAAVWVLLIIHDALSPHRGVVVAGAAIMLGFLVAGAAVAHRMLGRDVLAQSLLPPALTLSAALGWALAHPHGAYGLAAACGAVLLLSAVYDRVIGTGRWISVAAAVCLISGGLIALGVAAGAALPWPVTAAAVLAALGCMAVPALTARLERFTAPTVQPAVRRRDRLDRPFADDVTEIVDRSTLTDPAAGAGAALPSAEQVAATVRSAALIRTGLWAGLATVVTVAVAALVHLRPGWPSLSFALACGGVLALRSRCGRTVPERTALAVPAVAATIATCVLIQAAPAPLPWVGLGVLAAVALAATWAGMRVADRSVPHRWGTAAVYLDYPAVAALIPLALWPLEVYTRLGAP